MGLETALLGGLSAAGTAGSAMGGKAGKDAMDKQLKLQQQGQQYAKDIIGTGMSKAWLPSADYWTALLSGDPTKVQGAVGPISDTISRNAQAHIRNLSSTMPLGGEQRLAIANAQNDKYSNLARLYAGVQPTAASALAQMSGIPIGAGTSILGQNAPQVGAGMNYATNSKSQGMQGAQGAGALLYQAMHGSGKQGGSGKNSGGPNTSQNWQWALEA